jgi:hypothetical protein
MFDFVIPESSVLVSPALFVAEPSPVDSPVRLCFALFFHQTATEETQDTLSVLSACFF